MSNLLPVIQPKTALEDYQDVMEEANAPEDVALQVDTLVSQLLAAENILERGYARLGSLLNRIYSEKLWQPLGHETFGHYMTALAQKHTRGRTSLYSYLSAAQNLLPYMTETQLDEIGISKARELKKYVAATGHGPGEEIIQQAIDPKITVKDVKKLLFDAAQPDEKGTWVDFSGCYMDDNELMVYREAREKALRLCEAVKKDTPEHIRQKMFIVTVCMEFLGSHPDEEEAA